MPNSSEQEKMKRIKPENTDPAENQLLNYRNNVPVNHASKLPQ